MPAIISQTYDPEPTYPALGTGVVRGWDAAVAHLPTTGVLAVDGPHLLDWSAVVGGLGAALHRRGLRLRTTDTRAYLRDWTVIVALTRPVEELVDDPNFATLATGTLADLYLDDWAPGPGEPDTIDLVVGPGASLCRHDVLWYADLPKRYAEAAVASGRATNLGQRPGDGPATSRRLFYIDWPLLDRHRDQIATGVQRWVDTTDATAPTSIAGDDLLPTIAALARRPIRTRPTFNTTSWGGHWAQRELGINPAADNTALGYELIAPESGVLIGHRGQSTMEIPFALMVALAPQSILGHDVNERFGPSFPIRFDYLDTVDGGNLSVHCHPRDDYMRDVFGWPYTQHETYYLMVGGDDAVVYLGLRDQVDLTEFSRRAHAAHDHGEAFDIEEFVQTFPAEEHQLFLIPAGTPHGSGRGNVVLEVSATPYLYSLRFYDWLRRDATGAQRPVHVTQALRNLNPDRTGPAVARDLVQQPRTIAQGDGWHEELLGSLPEMFFDVRRLRISSGTTATQHTAGTFHVLNVVESGRIIIDTGQHRQTLNYAETAVIPAAVGEYRITAPDATTRVVKALVR